MCDTYPIRRQELDLYERDIVDIATSSNGKGFDEYHKAFSAQVAAHLRFSNKKVDWSVLNNKLFASKLVWFESDCFAYDSFLSKSVE